MTGSHFAATKNALRRRSHWINAAATANTATVASISPRGKNAEIEPSSSSPQYRSSKPDAAVSRHNPLDGVLSRSVLFTRCPPENPDVSFLIITSLLGSRKSSFCESGDVLAGGVFWRGGRGEAAVVLVQFAKKKNKNLAVLTAVFSCPQQPTVLS